MNESARSLEAMLKYRDRVENKSFNIKKAIRLHKQYFGFTLKKTDTNFVKQNHRFKNVKFLLLRIEVLASCLRTIVDCKCNNLLHHVSRLLGLQAAALILVFLALYQFLNRLFHRM